MKSTLECLNRDAQDSSTEWNDGARREWKAMLARYSNPARPQTATAQEGHAEDAGPFETCRRVLAEAYFEATPADLCALLALVREVDSIREQHDTFTIERIVRRLKSTPPTGPRDDAETEYAKSGPYRQHLKTQMRQRIAAFAPVAIALLDGVLNVIDTHVSLMRELELETAFSYGCRFVPSHTLTELSKSVAAIREARSVWQRSPELGDYTLLVRLVEEATPQPAPTPGKYPSGHLLWMTCRMVA